jgi:mono/diheme cytochrome c family protein
MTQPKISSSSPPLILALLLFGGLTLILMALFAANPRQKPGAVVAIQPTEVTVPTEVVEVANVIDPVKVAGGETIFQTTCAACHGFNAMGISGLGKPLIDSEFIDELSDTELLHFLIVGRDVSDPLNTTGVPMPAKGGNPGLTDVDLQNVIAYIRSLNVPAGTVAVEPTSVPEQTRPTATPYEFVPLPMTSADSAVENTPAIQPTSGFGMIGEALYIQNCSGCHALDGDGLPYLALGFGGSHLISEHDGMGLLLFLTNAQPPMNPETGFPHPYRGGYPVLTDEQLLEVIAYIYSINP